MEAVSPARTHTRTTAAAAEFTTYEVHAMRPRASAPTTALLAALPLATLLLAAPAQAAQQTVLLEEDFEAGFPPTWTIAGTVPLLWRIAEPGDCVAVSRMAAYNNASCTYFAAGWGAAGLLESPPVSLLATQPYELAFTYAVQVDPEDSVEVRLMPPPNSSLPPVLLASDVTLASDGQLHQAVIALPQDPFAGMPATVQFRFDADGTGNTGLGLMLDDVVLREAEIGVGFCAGDGSATPCPCGNTGAAGAGCANGAGPGAALAAIGSPSVAADDARLVADGLVPLQPALFFQGTNAVNGGLGVAFGDGLRCAGGAVVRLGVTTASAAGEGEVGPGLATPGGWSAGQTLRFQAWYRDPVGSMCGTGFNLSNGVELVIVP